MRSLRRSKFFLLYCTTLFLSACAGSKQVDNSRQLKPYLLANQNDGLVYDASFTYKDFEASGLLVMKREQEGAYHVALLSKFGVSLMEFKLDKTGITWLKTMGEMDNKVFEKLIERDFRLLLLTDLEKARKVKMVKETEGKQVYLVKGKLRSRVCLAPDSNKITNTENRGVLNPFKSRVSFDYTPAAEFPAHISLLHRNIDMTVTMTLLKINYAE